MLKSAFSVLIALLVAGCTPEPSEPASNYVVENAKSGDSVILWGKDEQRFYEIRLACMTEANGAESRSVLLSNLDAADRITFTPIGDVKPTATPQTYALSAEVFVDLGDGPQSVNEAQLLVGQAKLRKNATPQNCPRLKAMKQAQQDAKESRAGVWGNVK